MPVKHYNIPIFIPQMACPHQCVFCNQRNISGVREYPSVSDIRGIIEAHLSTIQPGNHIEAAFFGGNFTGIPAEMQERYLKAVVPYIEDRRIKGIRISTRPDYINQEILRLLKKYSVSTIELGIQSMDEEVLRLSGRGHSVSDSINASAMINDAGFSLGLQMMTGLPGDTLDKSVMTASKIIEMGVSFSRIYPALVIKDTQLEDLYNRKIYKPLSLDEAVVWSALLLRTFEDAGVKVIRIGLHPSEGLITGESLAAGPFHISFRELVLTEIWREILLPLCSSDSDLIINVPVNEFNYAVGYEAKNRKMLQKGSRKVIFRTDPLLRGREFYADYN